MHNARKRLTRDQVLTIPNAMSLLRLVLIPFIIWTYVEDRIYLSLGLVVASAATDVLDGFIARKMNMISDLGKLIDPVCDKLTHAALLICLMTTHPHIWILFVVLAVKELVTLAMGVLSFRKTDAVYSAKWYGKMCTCVFEGSMMGLMLFPDASEKVVHIVMLADTAVLLFSFFRYSMFYLGNITGKGGEKTQS